jgi:hypothetical protein
MKSGPDTLGTAEMSLGVQNMKKGTDAIGTAENESGSAKHECATLFHALRTAFWCYGDGMRKDSEIPPKRAFI